VELRADAGYRPSKKPSDCTRAEVGGYIHMNWVAQGANGHQDLEASTAMFGKLADPDGPNNALSQVLYGLALR